MFMWLCYEGSHPYTRRHTHISLRSVCSCWRETPDNSCQGFVTCNTNHCMLYHLQPFYISGLCVCVCVNTHGSEIFPPATGMWGITRTPHQIKTVSVLCANTHTYAHINHSFEVYVNDYVVPQQSIYILSSNNTTHYAFTTPKLYKHHCGFIPEVNKLPS